MGAMHKVLLARVAITIVLEVCLILVIVLDIDK